MIQTIHFLKIFILGLILPFFLQASETFTPYSSSKDVPVSVVELWDSYNPSSEELDTKVINETKENGVISRYVTYRVGTFKGVEARVAAYYTFPDKPGKHPAFVWTHGGGQRAEKDRGIYFAKQGYAVIDINWLGRSMENGVKENTDWGKVDPTQGPRFYKNALRKQWKRTLVPDEYSIDPVPSPRNSNWFLLAVAGKRGITFLEQQKEVDRNRIGFAGFSMGGVITAMNAIDPRLKAVAPFVGGTGFRHIDLLEFPEVAQRHISSILSFIKIPSIAVQPGHSSNAPLPSLPHRTISTPPMNASSRQWIYCPIITGGFPLTSTKTMDQAQNSGLFLIYGLPGT